MVLVNEGVRLLLCCRIVGNPINDALDDVWRWLLWSFLKVVNKIPNLVVSFVFNLVLGSLLLLWVILSLCPDQANSQTNLVWTLMRVLQ